VSVPEKLYDVKRRAMKVDGFPQNPEHFYTPEEMEAIRTHEEYVANIKLQEEARALVEARERRPYSELTRAEIKAAQVALGIDPYSGVVTQQPTKLSGEVPVISRLSGKRKAEGTPAGQEEHVSKHARADDSPEDDDADFEGDLFEVPIISGLSSKRKAEGNPAGQEEHVSKHARVDDCPEDDDADFESDLFGGR
jgi:hypothetical protein